MKRVISKSNLNMLILPLTDPQTESLEDYLEWKVVADKWEKEFVCVIGEGRYGPCSLVSYGRYDQVELSNEEKEELEKKIIFYGRKWLEENTDFQPQTH